MSAILKTSNLSGASTPLSFLRDLAASMEPFPAQKKKLCSLSSVKCEREKTFHARSIRGRTEPPQRSKDCVSDTTTLEDLQYINIERNDETYIRLSVVGPHRASVVNSCDEMLK